MKSKGLGDTIEAKESLDNNVIIESIENADHDISKDPRKNTAGIAANKPKAVAKRASAIPGATIAKLVFLDIAID